MAIGSNVSLIQGAGKRRPGVFVDCVRMTGIISADYETGDRGDVPTMTIKVAMPALGFDKPRVRRKCLTRPYIPA